MGKWLAFYAADPGTLCANAALDAVLQALGSTRIPPMAPAMAVKQDSRARLIAGIAIGLALLTSGCGLTEAPILKPKGPVALAERDILFRALAIMMIVVIPVFVMTFWFAWRYRASGKRSRYEPDWMSAKVDAVIWIVPALGGQIYAMAGMQTQLNVRADEPGRFVGRNTQYSGRGFADQHFAAIAMTSADFDAWVKRAGQSPEKLDATTYAELAKPSAAHPVVHYSAVESGLFDRIIGKYDKSAKSHGAMASE